MKTIKELARSFALMCLDPLRALRLTLEQVTVPGDETFPRDKVLHLFHTLRLSAEFLGIGLLKTLTRSGEEILMSIPAGTRPDSRTLHTLIASMKTIEKLLAEDGAYVAEQDPLLKSLLNELEVVRQKSAPADSSDQSARFLSVYQTITSPDQVDVKLVDNLMDFVGDLVLSHEQPYKAIGSKVVKAA